MSDDCRSRRGDLAAYALDRLDADERTRLLAHIDGCAECRGALDELRSTTRALPFASLEHLGANDVPPVEFWGAQEVLVIDQGRVVDVGSHADLVRRGGLYARLAELQFNLSAAAS